MFTVVCATQVKFMTIDFGGDQNTEIKMYHDFDMTKFPFISLTASTYSAIRESLALFMINILIFPHVGFTGYHSLFSSQRGNNRD